MKGFQERLRNMRTAVQPKLSQAKIARELGIKQGGYSKYERRPGSSIPVYLIPEFLRLTGGELTDLFFGKRPRR